MDYPRDSRGWARRLLSESTALLEISANVTLRMQLPWLAPRGDGHPVLLVPGFTASDRSTRQLRRFLQRCGYAAEGWGQGRNIGLSERCLQGIEERIKQLADQQGEQVSIIGWSAGGLYARAIGHGLSEHVRQVITMGSPFKLNESNLHHLPRGIYELHDRLSPAPKDPEAHLDAYWHEPPPVPSTSLYSRRDGIAPWPFCLDHCDPQSENIHVPGSHAGMTYNPLMYFVIADRLSQPRGGWRPFQINRLLRTFYRHDCASELARVAGH